MTGRGVIGVVAGSPLRTFPPMSASHRFVRYGRPAIIIISQLSATHIFTGKAGDHNHRRLQRDHLPVPAVISGFAKRGMRSRFRTRSEPASLLQPVIYYFLTLIFSAYGFVHNNNNNNNNNTKFIKRRNAVKRLQRSWQNR